MTEPTEWLYVKFEFPRLVLFFGSTEQGTRDDFEHTLGVICTNRHIDFHGYRSDVQIISYCKLCETQQVYSDDQTPCIENSICHYCIEICMKCGQNIHTDYSYYLHMLPEKDTDLVEPFIGTDKGKFSVYCGKCNFELLFPDEVPW